MIRKLSKNFILVLIFSLVVFVLFSTNLHTKQKTNHRWEIKTISKDVHEIYIRGNHTGDVTVADIKFFVKNFEPGDTSVESGGFFENAIVDNISSRQLNYLIIKSPQGNVNIDRPLLIIYGDVEISPLSQIYISQKGVIYPKVNK